MLCQLPVMAVGNSTVSTITPALALTLFERPGHDRLISAAREIDSWLVTCVIPSAVATVGNAQILRYIFMRILYEGRKVGIR